MSAKTVIGIALVAVAVIAPEIIPGILGVAAGSTAALLATAAVEVGLALTESAVVGPAKLNVSSSLNNQISRLYATLETTAPRKIVFGHTAMATDVRYDTYTGTNQEHYHQIICCAAHKVQSIDQIWIDNELAWTSGGGVQGRYVGYLTVAAVTEGNSSNGIAIDSTWTSSCTLTGCAYVHMDYLLIGPDSNTPSPFQGGVSSRLTIRGKGALIYNPRLDSTVPGGSGSHRADNQATWTWDDNAARNPALQELFYELGWKINGKLSVGKGVPKARLALEDYITAANICDEAVTLKAGGSEPRYRSDGVVSEGDDPKTVRDTLCSTMNAELRDNGSGVSLQILTNDLADISCVFDGNDILAEGDWDEAPPLNQYHNVVRGRCVDPSDEALYQLTDYPEWSTASPDGIDRVDPFDLSMVQSHTQAQRLAKLRGMRAQFQGRYNPTLGPRAWRTGIGRNVSFTHPVLPWSGKKLRTVAQKINRAGPTEVTLQEEDASIYAWNAATDEKTGITAGTPTVYDPNNNPLLSQGDLATILRNSYPKGLRVGASDAGGGHATITLDGGSAGAAFTIDYATATPQDVSVPAGSLTVANATLYYLFADVDVAGDSTPTYGATTTYADALNSATHPKRIYLNQYITTPAAGSTSTGGSPASGGYGGDDPYCVTVDTRIQLTADGLSKAAGQIVAGEFIYTQHEISGDWGLFRVHRAEIARDQEVSVVEIEGRRLRATPDHRVRVGGRWKTITELGAVHDGTADVVKITVAEAHTYVSNGILSHNIKALQ